MRMLLASHPRADAVVAALLKPGGIEAMLRWDQANPVSDFMLAAVNGSYDQLPKVDVPVLGVSGTRDAFLWPSQVKNSASYVTARFQYAEIKGGSHWMMLDHPAQVSKLLLSWLTSQPKQH